MATENEKTLQKEDLQEASGGSGHFYGWTPLADCKCPGCGSTDLEYHQDDFEFDIEEIHCISCGLISSRQKGSNEYHV